MKTTIEWIACADRLPDDCHECLVFSAVENITAARFHCRGNRFSRLYAESEEILDCVTHWAALPTTPYVPESNTPPVQPESNRGP